MTIEVGDKLPEAKVHRMTPEGPEEVTTEALFGGKRAVLFALPGAFTPTCSRSHLPGFIAQSDAIKAKGADVIYCLSVNDAFVMDAWGKSQNAEGAVEMLADGSAEFSRAIGLDADFSARGFGIRSQRYAMIVDDGKVQMLAVEEPGKFEVSGAEQILAAL